MMKVSHRCYIGLKTISASGKFIFMYTYLNLHKFNINNVDENHSSVFIHEININN